MNACVTLVGLKPRRLETGYNNVYMTIFAALMMQRVMGDRQKKPLHIQMVKN